MIYETSIDYIVVDKDIKKAAKRLLQYLSEHPNAADSLHGITTWWMVHQRFVENMILVQDALNYLVEKGLIKKRVNLYGDDLYYVEKKQV